MARENISSMKAAPETLDIAPEERSFRWASDNPLVRAVARVPLPIRAKQLVGTFAVAALLALVAVVGLGALGQSNSRGTELRRLQQQGGYEQLLLTDATQLKQLLDYRGGPDSNQGVSASYQLGFFSAFDQQVGFEFERLCLDAGGGGCPVI